MKLLEARHLARAWSVRVLALGSAIYAFLLVAPDQALALWNALPPEAQAIVPDQKKVGLILMVAAMIARAIRQGHDGAAERP